MLFKTKKLRENSLITLMMVNLMLPLFILSLLSFMSPQIYTIIPVYETQTCWNYFQSHESFTDIVDPQKKCGMQEANSIIFVFLNWMEIIGFAFLFWMVRNIKNELNVKIELQTILIFWTFFSIIYFSLNVTLQDINPDDSEKILEIKMLIFIAIILRNLSTLLATTMFSIYTMIRHPDKQYPKQIEGKLEALDFDLVLTSSLPF